MISRLEFWNWIKTGNQQQMQTWLMLHPEDLNTLTPEGIPAVLFALYLNQKDIAELFIQMGAQVDIFSAAAAGKLETLKALISESPKKANQYSADGYPLIGLACTFGQMDCVRYLISQGADVNAVAQNSLQIMPLHAAAAANRTDIVRLLLENGAEVNALRQDGFSAIHEAVQKGNLEMTELLIQYRADPALKTAGGKSAINLAYANRQVEIIQFLESL